MALSLWICSRCRLRLNPKNSALSRRIIKRSEDVDTNTRSRFFATVQPDSRPIDWASWFDSAAPYAPTISGAALYDRSRRSHHGREWIPPLRLQASFAPLDTVRRKPRPRLVPRPNIAMSQAGEQQNLRDPEWVRATLDYPTREEYPTVPEALFSTPTTVELNEAFKVVCPYGVVLFSNLCIVERSEVVRHWQHSLAARFPNYETISVYGEGYSAEDATKASLMTLISSMHVRALLRKPHEEFSEEEHDDLASQSRWQQGFFKKFPRALLHVYNFAAHFATIPVFRRWMQKEDIFGVGVFDTARVTVIVDLPSGHSIRSTGIGADFNRADHNACVDFKNQASQILSSEKDLATDLGDASRVGIDNAASILSLFKSLYADDRLVRFCRLDRPLKDSAFLWKFYYHLNDEILADPVIAANKDAGMHLADIVAAVALTNKYPELLEQYAASRQRAVGLILPPEHPLEATRLATITEMLSPIVTELDAQSLSEANSSPDRYNLLKHVQTRAHRDSFRAFHMRQYMHRTVSSFESRSESLRLAQEFYRHSDSFENIRLFREGLPVSQKRDEILSTIERNTYTIIVGSTGSGKSTQVPQMILEAAIDRGSGSRCNIFSTQPRRLAAKALAQRVADERDESLGEVVGYQMAGQSIMSELGGSITYGTPEMLGLQVEQDLDTVLDNISHFIIDEAHEREAQVDELLSALKRAIDGRIRRRLPCPKIIVMSATLDTELFETYFSKGGNSSVCSLQVPGKLHPVQELYLAEIVQEMKTTLTPDELSSIMKNQFTQHRLRTEERFAIEHNRRCSESARLAYNKHPIQWFSNIEIDRNRRDVISFELIAATIAHILKASIDGDILVFLPGWRDIIKLKDTLIRHTMFDFGLEGSHNIKIIIAHSLHPHGLEEGAASLPSGTRRVILSTTIAETSVTFPNVNFVVDPGIQRKPARDRVNRAIVMRDIWISQASATQRAGRAGRVRPGKYYALYSRERRETFKPAVHQTSGHTSIDNGAARAVLHAKSSNDSKSLSEYFDNNINPPPQREIDEAIMRLQELGAIDDEENLTYLGELLAFFPRDPHQVLLVFLGIIFECLEPALVIHALLDDHEIFLRPETEDDVRRQDAIRELYAQGTQSDHVAFLNIYREVLRMRDNEGETRARLWALDNMVHYDRFLNVVRHVRMNMKMLNARGLLQKTPISAYNTNSNNLKLVQALVVAALWPNIAVHRSGAVFWTPKGIKAVFRSSSPIQMAYERAVADSSVKEDNFFRDCMVCYSGLSSMWNKFGRTSNVTPVTPLAVLLFAGKLTRKQDTEDVLLVDNWFPIRIPGDGAAEKVLDLKDAWTLVWHNAIRTFARGPRRGMDGYDDEDAREAFVERLVDLINMESSCIDLSGSMSTLPQEIDNHVTLDTDDAVEDMDISKPAQEDSSNLRRKLGSPEGSGAVVVDGTNVRDREEMGDDFSGDVAKRQVLEPELGDKVDYAIRTELSAQNSIG